MLSTTAEKLVKKYSSMLIFFLGLLMSLGAEKFSVDIEPFSVFKIGTLGEYVFNHNDEKISQLDWNLSPLWEIGVGSDFRLGKFVVGGKFSFGMPLDVGKMCDSDWGYTGTYPNGFKFQYSENPIQQKLNFDSDISFSYKIPLFGDFSISPKIAVQYSYNSFETHDGYGWYGSSTDHDGTKDIPYDDERAKYYTTLFPAEYFRHTFFSWFGFSFSGQTGKFFFGGEFFVSPFTYESAIDYHHGVRQPFYTMILAYSYFSRFKICANFGWNLTSRFSIKFLTGGIFGGMTKADHFVRYGTEDNGYKYFIKTEQGTGSDTNYFFLGVSARIGIGK